MAGSNTIAQYSIFHLRHPRPMPLSLMIEHFSRILDIPVVPYAQWLSILDRALADWDTQRVRDFSIMGLVAFFRSHGMGVVRPASENGGLSVLMDVERSCIRCPVLQRASTFQFQEEEVRRWVRYWIEPGALCPRDMLK